MAEFTAHIANLGKYNAGVLADTTLSFPATTEQVQAALGEIGIDRLFSSEIVILDYNIGIKGVARALGEYTHIDELNYLASRLEGLDPEDMGKFIAAVEHGEYAGSAEQLINLTYNLDRYELYPVQNAEEYGLWLVDELAAWNCRNRHGIILTLKPTARPPPSMRAAPSLPAGICWPGPTRFRRSMTASTSRSSTRCSSTPSSRRSLCPAPTGAETAPSGSAHEGAFFVPGSGWKW